MEFRLRVSRASKLHLELQTEASSGMSPKTHREQHEILIADVISGAEILPPATDGAPSGTRSRPTWSLQRVVGDELRVENLDPSFFYQPGSDVRFSVRANSIADHASSRLTLETSVYRVSDGRTTTSGRAQFQVDSMGNSEAAPVDLTAPSEPGVYEVRCELVRDDEKIWKRFRRRDPPIIRVGRPIIVTDVTDPSQHEAIDPWQTVGVIRPSESSWSVGKWLPKQTLSFWFMTSMMLECLK